MKHYLQFTKRLMALLTALFVGSTTSWASSGALNGVFTINANNDKVEPELFDINLTRDLIPVLPPHGSGNDEPAYLQTSYDITVTADPAIGGTVSGVGPYLEGASCTLTATANPGYTFTNWTKNGTQVSTNATYTFTVTENADFVAHFSANTYEITATASPEAGGTVTGAGTYTHGETVTLTATPNEHYEFSHWTNGSALQYFTIESFEDNNTITLTIGSAVTQEHLQSLSYSTDNGATWITTTIDDTEQVISVSLNAGEKVLWKGTGVCLASNYSDNTQCSIFNGTKAHGVSGNIASLLFGDDFAGQTELPITPNDGRNYQKLFYQDVNLVEAHHLVLPFMVLQDNCYNRMFYGCSSLATAPALSATVLTNFCYRFMFAGCSSLTSAPVLPATTLATYCYENMFNGCTSLAVAPELPATTLKERCYSQMFDGCTSLSQAPILPATTLEDRCYYYMFRNCSLVNEVTCLATDISAPSCTLNWLNNVASTGTFHNAVGMEAWGAGTSGIPTGWTVAPAADYTNQYFTIESLEDGNTITLTIGSAVTSAQLSSISYSTDNGATWNTTTVDNTTQAISVTLNNGQKAMWKGLGLCMASGYNNETQWSIFTGTKQHIVYGNIASLLFGDDFTGQFVLPAGTNNGRNYQSLFRGNAYLVSAENLVIPFTTLQNNCYASMFHSCTSLTVGPELPAMNMTQYCYSSMFRYCSSLISAPMLPSLTMSYACYSSMFQGCTSLTQAPELPAPTLASTCYQAMFSGCSSLSEMTCLATNVSATNCTQNWLSGVASTGSFHKATGSVNWNSGSSGIPSGWNVEGVSPFDPTQPSVSFTVVESADYIAYFNIEQFEILASASPEDYGTVTGGGYYPYGSTCTLTADALEGYHFDGWTKDGAVVATSRVYAFTVEEAGSYVANFSVATYAIVTAAEPEEGGTVTGGGTYTHGETVTLTATPNPGYEFDHWGPGYEFQYFTIESLEDGNTITLTIGSAVTQAQMQNISYSTDNGITWNTTTIDNTEQVINVSLNAGEKVLWKGLGTNMASGYQEASQWSVFNSTKQHVVYGNIASLLFGDDFEGQMSLSKGRTYQRLFSNDSNLVAAEHLILPFTNLQVECYSDLFNGCSSLVSAPKLPAVTIKSYCYQSMFNGCSSLLVAPDLPATTLQSYCYNNMFKGCASLTAAPELPATTLANYCYTNMFNGCTSLLSAPTLPATTLANYCYHQMFQGCSSLKIAPALPATSLAERCYWAMFYGCSLLEQAPELPAVTLTDYCYDMMFKYCSSLANAPVLPAQTLTQYCYYQMFWDCSLINEITCLATDISATGATEGWLYNVASSGTFHKAPEMTGWATGTSGIPANWTVEDNTTNYQTPFEEQYFTIESLEDENTITLTIPAVITTSYMTSVSYSTDNGTTWNTTEIDGTAKTISVSLANSGDKVLFKGLGRSLTYGNSHDTQQTYFSGSKQYIVYGNIASLLYGDDFEDKTQFPDNSARTYQGLFAYSDELISAQNLVLPYTILAGHCYRDMFTSCDGLTQAPQLPATTLNNDCYMNMFGWCTSLTLAPELPAATLVPECYNQMFRACSSLTHAPELPAETLAYMCYYRMFEDCTALTHMPVLPATTLASTCYYRMFAGCTSLTKAPELPATVLTYRCYKEMFYGCTSLNEITCLATDLSETECTLNWLINVASTGTFHKASGMNDWPTGVSGIPSGWTVEDPEQEPAINLNEPTISFEVTESGLYVAYFNPIIAMQTFELVQGWNWWAPMVKVTAVQLQDSIGNSLVQIKTEEGIVGENIEPGEMYRIQTSAPCEVSLVGLSITPVEVSLAPGANWFGSICVEEKPIAAAISVEATAGDKIVSQNGGFAIYNGTVWDGTLTTLQPGCGYVYVTTESKTLIVDAVGINEPTVTTSQVTNVTQTTATCGGNVTDDGGGQVTERGICWGTSQNPTISGSHGSSGTGTGSYTVNMTGLTANTTYYVRAYATNSEGTAYGNEVSFTTEQLPTYTVTVSASPSNGGSVSGGGTYQEGQSCTVAATASNGNDFVNWTENGTQVSTNASYTFTVTGNRTLVANFEQQVTLPTVTTNQVTDITQTTATCGGNVTNDGNATVTARGVCWSTSQNPTVSGSHTTNGTGTGSFTSSLTGLTPNTTYYVRAYATNSEGTAYGSEVSFTTLPLPTYTISVSASPAEGGTVTGGGTYEQGQSCTLTATANEGYAFVNWTENGNEVSTDGTYTFTVDADRALVANFTALPTGAIDGKFSINADGDQVYFSQGNLQYIGSASTPYWKFADNQWDYLGTTTGQNSSDQNVDRDLFGWGTSGYNHGANCYQPWSTSTNTEDYYAYGSYTYNLYDQTGQADWGYNPISNGGNQANQQWRTLTRAEWVYVFDTRSTVSGIRYAKANVNNVNGVILLPDDWSSSIYSLNNTNTSDASYSSNTITSVQWATLEQAGAVFLPAPGWRDGTSVINVGSYGYYWSASYGSSNYAYFVGFYNSSLYPQYGGSRGRGRSVRLVITTLPLPTYTISVSASPAEGGTVTGGGTYVQGQSCTLTATANEGYAFVNWTENGNEVLTDATYTFTVDADRALVANFTALPTTPEGAIDGKFSINADGDQIYFSQGNLQYIGSASTPYWKFADNQWDYLGTTTGQSSSDQNVDRDLFGWGTSGYNHGANCYQPWSTSTNTEDYNAYGSDTYHLYDQTGQADWGYNPISNGGNQANQWRTLTTDEWGYVFNTRSTASGIRYAKAKVNNVNGVILLPDDWNSSTYSLSNTNTSDASYSSNTITSVQWATLEQAGAVFLPAAGSRSGTSVYMGYGKYWSASCHGSQIAYSVYIHNQNLYPQYDGSRYFGESVRLVANLPTVTTNQVSDITQTTATCGGTVTDDGGLEVTARGVCWSTSHNPSLVDSHTTDGTGTGSFTSTLTGLTLNTTYYVRAYATNSFVNVYGSEVSFTTLLLPTISVSVSPAEGGTVTGGGTYEQGQSCTLTATANEGYAFVNWTENGNEVSTDATYTFTVDGDRALLANFTALPTWPNGILPGQFSVSASQQVYFSQGNLQYIGTASTPYWKFANNQWDYLGTTTGQNSSDQNVDRDLFGWGTSGYNHGAVCYQPWSTSQSYEDYYAYGSYTYNLYDQTGQADWGYNPISNGGNQENHWRTLTTDEWGYVFNTRSTASGIRFAKANVNNVNGVILLPDDWSSSIYSLSNTNTYGASCSSNTITSVQWATLEQAGAVFLPAAGLRDGTSVINVGSYGRYWSASYYDSSCAYYAYFSDPYLGTHSFGSRYCGFSVRLVTLPLYTISVSASPAEGGTVTGGGTYVQGQSCTLTATANEGYAFVNWMENGNEVSTDGTYTFTVDADRALVANFTALPTGAIDGKFSINADGDQIYFSQGNLQYKASTDTWRFATNQWDYVGDDNSNISSTYSGWIDLFGWGTSGYNHGATCYQPWSTSTTYSDYYAYGSASYNLYDQTGQADWGYNPISNGGNQANLWRTLTRAEWAYVFNTRSTASGIRFAKANVNNVNGVILLPDDWSSSIYSLNNTNTSDASYSSNTITSVQWATLEQAGAVFLPAAGLRRSASVYNAGSYGYYWSASYYNSSDAWFVNFYDSDLNPQYNFGRGDGRSVRLVTLPLYTISVSASPAEGGTVTGGGTYVQGQSCTLTATANEGYAFVNWTENGNEVSTDGTYTFTVDADRALVANFEQQVTLPTVTTNQVSDITQTTATCGGTVTSDGGLEVTARGVCWSTSQNPTVSGSHTTNGTGTGSFTSSLTGLTPNTTYYVRAYATNSEGTAYGNEVRFTTLPLPTYTISVSASPAEGGTVTGGGTYEQGQSCTLTATANEGCAFVNWTENGNEVSTDATYTFTVDADRALVANFTWPNGILPGQFSVSASQQVYFSQGNLQYKASTDTWRFATNQWDYVGSNNSNISSTYSGWIDLFGWGTSGYNHGANCYQPWSTSATNSDYYAYGSYTYNLYDQTGQADWGYNPISNGGNQANQWRTLTRAEWVYVFDTRSTASGIRYAKAKVNNVTGVILLPDDWNSSTYSLSNTNTSGASYSSNTITATQWSTLEQAGAVFLPAAGRRSGTSAYEVGSYGYYWSAYYCSSSYAYRVFISGSELDPQSIYYRYSGFSVRLAANFEEQVTLPTVTTNQVSDITQTTATCGGTVTDDGGLEVTARGVCWSTSQNPTVSGSHTTNGTGTGSFTSSITGLSPNTTYYVRAYATNSAGTAYGTQRSFTTTQNITQLTVFDGTVTDERVPVVGWVLNHYTKCEYVMPASHLSSMIGKTITSMACYSNNTSVNYAATFKVFIKEVSFSTISSFQGYSGATTVYEGSLSVTNGMLTIEFTTPLTYNGGNLLIGFYNISPGTGQLGSKRFYGVTATDSSVVGWNRNSLNNITSPGEFPNFLPKTTFYFSN